MPKGSVAGRQSAVVPALLRGVLVPIGAVGALCIAVGATRSGAVAAGALVGTVLAALAFVVGPGVLALARSWAPPAVMALAMTAYLVLIGVLAVLYLLLLDVTWMSQVAAGWTLLLCAAAAVAGQIRATSRLRVPAFGDDPEPPAGAVQRPERAGQHDDEASTPGDPP